MNNRETVKAIDKVRAGMKRRYAAEKRFQRYGLTAIVMGLLFLAVLFTSIIGNGYSAFVQTYVKLDVEYSESKIDPQSSGDLEVISSGDFGGIVKASVRDLFPFVKKRKEKRKLYGLVSTGATYQIRDQVLEDPSLIGKQAEMWVPADDDADMFFKGYITSQEAFHGTGVLRSDLDGNNIKFDSGKDAFNVILAAIDRYIASDISALEKDIQRKQDDIADSQKNLVKLNAIYDQHLTNEVHERANDIKQEIESISADIVRYQSDIEKMTSSLEEMKQGSSTPQGKRTLTRERPSYLVAMNDGLVKLVSVGTGQASGEILIPPSSYQPVEANDWQIIMLKTPETDRRLSDKQVAWLLSLQEQGRVEKRFNTTFFTAGDSREPELAGILSAAKGSFYALMVTLLLSFPIGVSAAIYLEEFAPQNRWTDLIEVNINNLAAVPSIVFGLLGLAMFINFFGLPRSAPLVGGLVLTLMTLPTIIIASRAALKSVPPSIREAALGVGASRVQMVFYHVLPLAMPGMLTGTIIGMAQALGESAPLLMIGMVAFIVDVPQGVFDPATALPVQIYLWADSPERAFVERTSAAIMVLLGFLISMNALAVVLRKRFERRW